MSNIRGYILALGIFLVVLVAIPLTLYLVKQQQNLSSQATAAGSLVFIPAYGGSVEKGQAINLEFGINLASENRITGADITITYSANLRLDSFTKDTTVLPEEILDSRNPITRNIHYVAVNKTGNLDRRSFIPLGTFAFTAIGDGTATVNISNNQIVAKDQPGTLAIENATTTYTVAGPTASPTASPTATPTPTPIPTFAPCINGALSGESGATCNGYRAWLNEFQGKAATKTTDFYLECRVDGTRGDGIISINDYNIWRREYDARNNEPCQ